MKTLLLEIKDTVAAALPERDTLLPAQLADFETRYDTLVTAGLQVNALPEPAEPLPKKRGKPKQHPAKNLADHFKLRNQETLAFIYDLVPFDNNQAERDLSMVKLKQKCWAVFAQTGELPIRTQTL